MSMVISKMPAVEAAISTLIEQSRTIVNIATTTPMAAAIAEASATAAASTARAAAEEYGECAGRRMSEDGIWHDAGWRLGPL